MRNFTFTNYLIKFIYPYDIFFNKLKFILKYLYEY